MAIRLKNDFRSEQPLASLSADWLNTVANWLNNLWIADGDRTVTPKSLTLYAPATTANSGYSFSAAKTGDTELTMTPGDVWLGPITVTHWADFTGESTTPSVTETNTCVWLVVNVVTAAVAMKVGPRSGGTAGTNMEDDLDATEDDMSMIVPLVETTWTAGVITAVKNLYCGDVLIPRAAG